MSVEATGKFGPQADRVLRQEAKEATALLRDLRDLLQQLVRMMVQQ